MAPVLITLTGPDHPGITATMATVLERHGARLRDVQQVTVMSRLILCFLVETPETTPVLKDLLFTAKELGLHLDYDVVDASPSPNAQRGIVVTALADPVHAGHLRGISTVLTAHQANIHGIEQLSAGDLTAVEIRAALAPAGSSILDVRTALLSLGLREGFDLAVQAQGLTRRAMRLAAMDMDSTLIRVEVIDELARAHGVLPEVKAMTAQAMAGDLDYSESLTRRVALLQGLSVETVHRVADDLPLQVGAERMVGVLKRLGFRTAVISGGFDVAAQRVQARLGLDHAYSNRLESDGGVLTGRVIPPIVSPERKAELLRQIAEEENIPLEQTLAIGDGANDLKMMECAGLGIAFHAKPLVRASADTTVSKGGLDRVLHLLGIRSWEIQD